MVTNQELIEQALQELRVIEQDNSANSADSAKALAVLNQMMLAWAVSDMDFNWFAQDTLTDVAPIPGWAEEGVISNLAVKCAVPFNRAITVELNLKATEGRNAIARTLINQQLEGADLSLLAQGAGRRYDILTDS